MGVAKLDELLRRSSKEAYLVMMKVYIPLLPADVFIFGSVFQTHCKL